ncbi:phosphoserine phosphatase-like [Halyomorpha halys]|uniref:phosphoserine phosphatase-like n=1 Tax=Halyomorpha halys TaxID=286706 RepID=UPI0034D35E20
MASNVKAIWKKADAVCFDVDSTIIREEAIDKLAEFCGKGKEIQAMTSAAMSGKLSFRGSLSTRLNLIQPSMQQVQEFIRSQPPSLSVNINPPVFLKKFGYSNIVMIGDGNTDAEASPPAHAFIGYGGNVVREAVKNKSQWYVTDFQELIDELS